MKRTTLIIPALVVSILAGCSAAGGTTPPASGTAVEVSTTPGVPAGAGIEQKLAAGTLALEETENAVTAEQAKVLLPLWKAVNALSSADTTTVEEIEALYKQIQAAMTEEQLAAVEALEMTGDSMSALMAKYVPLEGQGGGQAGDGSDQNGFPGGNFQPGMGADFQPPTGGAGGGGPTFQQGGGGRGQFGGGGSIPDGGGFVIQGEGMLPQMEGTPGAGGAGPRMMMMNNLFVQPLITLLKARAG